MSLPSVGAEYLSAMVKVKSAEPDAGNLPGFGVCGGILVLSFAAASVYVQ